VIDGESPRESLWVQIAREIVDRIVAGTYPPDSTIPTESDFGQEFRVSRTVVRESIKSLAHAGLVRIDRGRGTVVEQPSKWRSLDPTVLAARLRHDHDFVVLRELFVVRKGVEPELAALVAQSANPADIARIGARVDELVNNLCDADCYLAADMAFHAAIAEIAHVSLAQEFLSAMAEPLALSRALTNQIPGGVNAAHGHHLAVFRAIIDRDPGAAREAMREHIEWAENHLDMLTGESMGDPLGRESPAPDRA
jgi:DNA-binding FadR family transcriptional regulator